MTSSIDDFLSQKQQRINDFLQRANTLLPEHNPLFFDGSFITGQIYHPDMLFIGINPGHRGWHDVTARQQNTRLTDYRNQPCKYIAESITGNRFAKRVIDVVCGGDSSRLENCAETSLLSYFASPTESVVKAQIKHLPKAMQLEHAQLTELPIHQIKPKHIVCIGWRTFDEFIKRYGQHSDAITRRASTKKLPICIKGEDKMMDYYTKVKLDCMVIHGIRHFSTPLSHAMLEDMRAVFKQIWQEIEISQDNSST